MNDTDGHDWQDLETKVKIYLSLKRFDAAEKLLRSHIANHGDQPNTHNLLGLCYHKQSRFADAADEFASALKCDPRFAEAALNLSATLCDLGRYDEGRNIMQEWSRTESVSGAGDIGATARYRAAQHHAATAKLYEAVNMNQEAMEEYRKALELVPVLTSVQLNYAKLCWRMGDNEQARSLLEQIISREPDETGARNLFALVMLRMGRIDLAMEQWQKSAALSPSDLVARAYLSLKSNLEAKP